MRVLYVEDTEINRRVVREMLAAGGFEMAEAGDGPSGLQMIADHDYDLVLMDLRMPGMDGLAALRRLRARGDAKGRMPVIVVTADADGSIEAECRAAGADGLLLKPLSMAALFDAIGKVLARRRGGDIRVA
jgi:CheY-like chemotaxis protein